MQHVLAVVDELAGLAIDECRGAAAEPAARLEHQHPCACLGEPGRRAQPGESGADDHGVDAVHGCSSHCRSAISACSGLDTRTRDENTS